MTKSYHKYGCDGSLLNPVTEYIGENMIAIVAYKCPKCKKKTLAEHKITLGLPYKTNLKDSDEITSH